MKRIQQIAGITAGIVLFVAGVHCLNNLYMSDSDWERILWHHFYADQGKINNLYLGSSHVYCDIDPMALDMLNGEYNFNLATSGQLMNGTYYLLKEADRNNELEHVYVELYYMFHTANNVDQNNMEQNKAPIETDLFRNWQNTDYMRLSSNKLAYMLAIAGPDQYPDIFLGFSRYRSYLDNWEYVENQTERKKSNDYNNYICQFTHGTDKNGEAGLVEYRPKGFYYSTTVYADRARMYLQERTLGENPMLEQSEAYLRKVIAYCRQRDIPVTLFISPIYELQLISTEHYDNYLNQVRAIASEYQVDFYDFNLAKEEYLPIQDTVYFMDIGHLNAEGANLYTAFFYNVVSGSATDNADYFYESYSDKLQHTTPCVYGIYYHNEEQDTDNKNPIRIMRIASNRESGMEYRIILTPDEKEQYMVQDFSENKMFTIDCAEHGICTIVYRTTDTPEIVQTIEIDY